MSPPVRGSVRPRRYNVATGARNQLLRKIVKFIASSEEGACRSDLEDEFRIGKNMSRTAVVDLMNYNVIGVLREEKVGGAVCHYYRTLLAADDEKYLDSIMPQDLQTALAYNYAVTKNLTEGVLKEKHTVNNCVCRDPLDVLLMGNGEAPSLAFHRSRNA